MLECKSEVPYVITLERELSQMPLKMRFLDVKQGRGGGLQYFYAVITNFRHSKTDRIKAPVDKVSFPFWAIFYGLGVNFSLSI